MQWLCGSDTMQNEVFTLNGCTSLQALQWREWEWECQHGWDTDETGCLYASSWQCLCAISSFQPQTLSFHLPARPLLSFVLPTGTPPFYSPPTEPFHTLLLRPLAAAAFLSLSSRPPTSHPILLQIWGFDTDFPSDPFLPSFLCFVYLSPKCRSHLALFLCLTAWWRVPAWICARSTGHILSQWHGKKGR